MQELDAVKNMNHTLQQELQAARVHHTELQRDSMKLVLQIVSKGLYHNSFSMRPDNSRVDTENAQDFEKRRSTTNKTLKTSLQQREM